jgi:hypothetical protein
MQLYDKLKPRGALVALRIAANCGMPNAKVTTPQDHLRAAADLLETSLGAWIQGKMAKNASGEYAHTLSPNACSWCALGAIARVQKLPDAPQEYNGASKLLTKYLRAGSHTPVNIVDWNDHHTRTREDVIIALRLAASGQL